MTAHRVLFRNMPADDQLQLEIEKRIHKLETFYDHIIRCEVHLSYDHRKNFKGHYPQVQISVKIPGATLVIKKKASEDDARAIPGLVADAFDAMNVTLEERIRQRRGFTKHHEPSLPKASGLEE